MKLFYPILSSLVIMSFVLQAQPCDVKIHFTVTMEDPEHHCFHVALTCSDVVKDSLDLTMPAWCPGYYEIEDFSKHVLNFRAEKHDGASLSWEKTDKNTWRLWSGYADTIRVTYDVYAYDISVASPYLDEGRGFISPVGVFMYIEGMIGEPVALTIQSWNGFKNISTGLDPLPSNSCSFYAPDFNVLYDCPILLGNQEIIPFLYKGIPHSIAIEDPGEINKEKLISDFTKIVETASAIIGEIPYKHYTFIMMKSGMGGLEHSNSMAVFYDPYDFLNESNHEGALGFIAHEYFHLYNVKTIRPYSLGPFDYEKENDTRLLWISEGFTVYYENLILNRAGLLGREKCLNEFSRIIRNFENVPGHLFQSVAESGTDTWMQFFNFLDPNAYNTTISYYDKGCILGMLLDLKIRHEKGGSKCLDDVMKRLYVDFYKNQNRGFTEKEFQITCESVAGCPLDEIFRYVSSVAAIDYPKYLAYAGIEIDTAYYEKSGIYTGIRAREEYNKLSITRVDWYSPGWKAGLSPGDEIVAINENPVYKNCWEELTGAANPGDTIRLTVTHRGNHYKRNLIAGIKTERTYHITSAVQPEELQSDILTGWLRE
jgi:predicted metalloprotease with PDZ domain